MARFVRGGEFFDVWLEPGPPPDEWRVADIARAQIQIAARAVKDAIDEYKSECAAYRAGHTNLAEALEKAALASSGGDAKLAARVRTSVESIPLVELTIQKLQALGAKCVTVPESHEACAGGGLTSNGSQLSHHNGILVSWKER